MIHTRTLTLGILMSLPLAASAAITYSTDFGDPPFDFLGEVAPNDNWDDGTDG